MLSTSNSLIASDELAQFVSAKWHRPAPDLCRLLNVGQNDTYVIESDGGDRVAARVYRAGWRTDDDVRFELELLRHLRDRGVGVAEPFLTSEGEYFHTIQAPEGPRQVAVFRWAVGRRASLDPFPAARYGALMGMLHREADTFDTAADRFVLDQTHLIDEPTKRVLPLLASDDAEFVTNVAATGRAALASLAGDDEGVCHADLMGNVHHDNDLATIFDFDCAGVGSRAYDLATFLLQFHAWAPEPNQLWREFIDGYRTERALHEDTVVAAELFVPIRYLWLLGLHAGIGDFLGHNRDEEWLQNRLLGGLRSWTAANASQRSMP